MVDYLLIDGDILVMKAGYASEEAVKKEVEGSTIVTRKINPYVDYTRVIDDILYRMHQVFPEARQVIVIGGEGNFRKELNPDYKGNRNAGDKPLLYDDCRNWLIDKYKASSVDGVETDDVLGMLQCMTEDDTCIASIDKDLLTIPGEHYCIDKDIHLYVSEEEALYNYCHQMLTGDSTDNIPGLPGIGKVKATKILGRGDRPLDAAIGAYEERLGEDFKVYWENMSSMIYILRNSSEFLKVTYDDKRTDELGLQIKSITDYFGMTLNESTE